MAKKPVIPWELKADFRLRGWTSLFKGLMFTIREKYGAAAALEIIERIWKMDNRTENLTNFFLTTFKIEGNNGKTMAKWWDIWYELTGSENITLEQSEKIYRNKVTKCPWKTKYTDISDWCKIYTSIVDKTINTKTTVERPKAMCLGDPHCEWVAKIQE
jgi:hypothetical protein